MQNTNEDFFGATCDLEQQQQKIIFYGVLIAGEAVQIFEFAKKL
jgi:hypothetical protein